MKNKILLLSTALALTGGYITYDFFAHHKESHSESGHHDEHEEGHGDEVEKGVHGGRLLEKDDFAIEATIFEDGVPPEFRFYAYDDGELLNPKDVELNVELTRLNGKKDNFTFSKDKKFFKSNEEVKEPHSFDVKITAKYDGKTYEWKYDSYEGRVQITEEAAKNLGIEIEKVAPVKIEKTVPLYGIINLDPNKSAQIKARFSGVVKEIKKDLNEPIKKGDVLAMVEGNDSLQIYPVTSPIDGVIIERNASVGEVTSDTPLFVIADLSSVVAEFSVFSKDIENIKNGQKIYIQSKDKKIKIKAMISAILKTTEASSQTVIARAFIDNTQNLFRSGMIVKGAVVIDEKEVPLAVKISALQKFRDMDVVFVKVGETYEVRMLELGERGNNYVEVLEGIERGDDYVSKNSFVIKADIEKSGASHDH
ncbi:MAG TPA: HlyD family secretion protein [Alphaproteobacteria bacterium]|nr:HlyD family secretion protein [Alphaproteobacteria bacterium]